MLCDSDTEPHVCEFDTVVNGSGDPIKLVCDCGRTFECKEIL